MGRSIPIPLRTASNGFCLLTKSSCPALCIPDNDGDASRYGSRDYRLSPLRREMGRVGEDIADEGRHDADGRLPTEAVRAAIHLEEGGYGTRRSDNPANRSEAYVGHAECSEDVAACHHQKAGEPRAGELFECRAGEAPRSFVERIEDAQSEA